ncbi:hypothetical protein GCM10025857_52750 [Alicyclobacillus contaminans]|nr:hypothetical protein GCM10025857_52750 [Alicyclobacillus contaminans]
MGEENFLAQSQPLVYEQMKRNVEHEHLAHAYILKAIMEAVNMRWLCG